MEVWAILQLAMALATTVGCLALIIGQLHVIERAESDQWLNDLKQSIRIPQ